jgi:hypothetical protein
LTASVAVVVVFFTASTPVLVAAGGQEGASTRGQGRQEAGVQVWVSRSPSRIRHGP